MSETYINPLQNKINSWIKEFEGLLGKYKETDKARTNFNRQLTDKYAVNKDVPIKPITLEEQNKQNELQSEWLEAMAIIDKRAKEFKPFLIEIQSDIRNLQKEFPADKDIKFTEDLTGLYLDYLNKFDIGHNGNVGHDTRYEVRIWILWNIYYGLEGRNTFPMTPTLELNLYENDIDLLFSDNGIVTIGQLIALMKGNDRIKHFQKNGKFTVLFQALTEAGLATVNPHDGTYSFKSSFSKVAPGLWTCFINNKDFLVIEIDVERLTKINIISNAPTYKLPNGEVGVAVMITPI